MRRAIGSDHIVGDGARARALELYLTDPWAAAAILDVEILTPVVVDPCAGTGIMATAARAAGYSVDAYDVNDWGWPGLFAGPQFDFLTYRAGAFEDGDVTVFMNPPFSKACDFVDRATELNARKIVCFQRLAWWEAGRRAGWREQKPPARIYICGSRATCWLASHPLEKRTSGTPTAHAWFVWERGHPAGTTLGRLYRGAHPHG